MSKSGTSWKGVVVALLVVLSAAGFLVSRHLTAMHASKTEVPSWFIDSCDPKAHPSFNCEAVLKSRWAVFPPYDPDPETGEQPGIPVALLGWYYFTAIGLWYAFVGAVPYERRKWHKLVLAAVCLGCAASAFFMIILLTRLEQKCLWCMVSHGINFLILAGSVLAYPRRPAGASEAQREEADERPEPEPMHPRNRLILATAACAGAAMAAETYFINGLRLQAERDRYLDVANIKQTELDAFREDVDLQLALYRLQHPVDIEVRVDDPSLGDESAPIEMVVFSDFECPVCRWFARDLKRNILPDFEGQVHLVWKHLPLDAECNPAVEKEVHPHACEAAYAAEAARLQGGNEAFWKYHDALYEAQSGHAGFDFRALAVQAGLDPERLFEDMHSEQVQSRVEQDVRLAQRVRATSTPTVFLGGRKLVRFLLYNDAFIDAVQEFLLSGEATHEH